MPKVLYSRGGQSYIVERDGNYYLINPASDSCILAKPPNMPDMFLKQGYFDVADNTTIKSDVLDAVLLTLKRHIKGK